MREESNSDVGGDSNTTVKGKIGWKVRKESDSKVRGESKGRVIGGEIYAKEKGKRERSRSEESRCLDGRGGTIVYFRKGMLVLEAGKGAGEMGKGRELEAGKEARVRQRERERAW